MVKEHSIKDSIRNKSKIISNSNNNINNTSKTVFRPVLDNPLNVSWPTLSPTVRKLLLDALIEFLTTPMSPGIGFNGEEIKGEEMTIAEWRLTEHAKKRGRIHKFDKTINKGKGKEIEEVGENGKRVRLDEDEDEDEMEGNDKVKKSKVMEVVIEDSIMKEPIEQEPKVEELTTHTLNLRSTKTYTIPNSYPQPLPIPKVDISPVPPPKISNYCCIGINEVTKALEDKITWGRKQLGDSNVQPLPKFKGRPEFIVKNIEEEKGKEELKKKSRKRHHHKVSNESKLKSIPTSIQIPILPKPLDTLHPTSTTTRKRPSFQFLSRPITKSMNTSSHLQTPQEPNPFFQTLAQSHSSLLPIPDKFHLSRAEFRRTFLEDIITADDPQGDRITRIKELQKEKKKVTVKQNISKIISKLILMKKNQEKVARDKAFSILRAKLVKSGSRRPGFLQDQMVTTMDNLKVRLQDLENLETLPYFHSELTDPQLKISKEGIYKDLDILEEYLDDLNPTFDLFFVCRHDINPPSLVAHLPTLAATVNGVAQSIETLKTSVEKEIEEEEKIELEQKEKNRLKGKEEEILSEEEISEELMFKFNRFPLSAPKVFLIPLDLGSEAKLSEALALRRVSSIAIDSLAPGITKLYQLILKYVTPLEAPWLIPHLNTNSTNKTTNSNSTSTLIPEQILIPTHIKHLKSTAPIDLKASLALKKELKKNKKLAKRGELYVAKD